MEKATVKPSGKERVYNVDTNRYITGETEVYKTAYINQCLKRGELVVASKAVKKPIKSSIKKDKE